MKAIVVRNFGSSEVLKLEEVQLPEPDTNQVLVKIYAAGVNPVDTYIRSGNYANKPSLPYTPGIDGAGIVEKTGKGVKSFKAGDRVYMGGTISGTYAEYALALESQLHRLPDNISFSGGAGIYLPYFTSFHAIHHHARANRGETILIHGSSGGVGIASIQIAKSLDLKIFGTAGTEKGMGLVKKEGAHMVFNHNDPGYQEKILKATNGKGIDIIIEMLANINLASDLKLLSKNGRIVIVGSRGEITINPRELMSRRASIHGVMLWLITEKEALEIDSNIYSGLERGLFHPIIREEIPLSEAQKAHTKIMQPGAYGKIVIVP